MELKEILAKIPSINEKRNYWLVRTNGGDHFDAFMAGSFIAIGYNKITLEDIKSGNTKKQEVGIEILSEKIKKVYKDDEKRYKHTAKQLIKFAYKIKRGDVVLIPSSNSKYISFGEITDSHAFNDFEDKFECHYFKRKKVKWLKTITRTSLDPNLYKLMYSHHTISEANPYDAHIDKILNSFFVKGDQAHIVLEVQTTDEIKARSLFALGGISLELFDSFCEEENFDFSSDDFDVKLAVESPGYIELMGADIAGIVILGLIIVGITGGGFKLHFGDVKVGLKTDGIIEKIRVFLNSKDNKKSKKELKKYIKDLKVKNPKELKEILKKLDK